MPVDLNADVSERSGPASEDEVALFRVVTSVNIACGVHAGDPSLIRRTLQRAREHGVAAGAHPSLADREGFGRRVRAVDPRDVENLVLYQVSAVMGLAAAESVAIRHVKPHGALYHLASDDDAVADAVASATALCGPGLRLVGFAGSRLIEAGRRAGLQVLAEAFVDRAYGSDGRLLPRDQAGAVITDPRRAAEQALRLALAHRVRTADGADLEVVADTLCVHGDTPGAVRLADAVRQALEREGIVVEAPRIP